MKNEEIARLLAEKFKRESARLNSWGTKTDEKAAFSFAMSVVEFVRALMCDSRYRELKRVLKQFKKYAGNSDEHYKLSSSERTLRDYIEERMKATKAMTIAIQKFALEKEGKREWKPKVRTHHKENSSRHSGLSRHSKKERKHHHHRHSH